MPNTMIDSLAPEQSERLSGPTATFEQMRIHKYHVPEILFGLGAFMEIGGVLRRLGAERPFLVSDPGLCEAGWVDKALPVLAEAGLVPAVWTGLTSNPKDFEVQAGLEHFLSSGCDVLLAIGGGSCIDAAKAIALMSTNGGQIGDFEGVGRASCALPPMVMVPSTGGTGSDVSQFCVITDTSRRLKITIAGQTLVPDVSVTDPLLLTTMSSELTACTALDALSHAVEAYVSKAADFLSDAHALSAIRGLSHHLLSAVDNPRDIDACQGLARASLQAGLAFTNGLLGATHAISHQIGGALDVHHGLVNALLLPYVIEFNAPQCAERYSDIAQALGVVGVREAPESAAQQLAEWIRSLADKVGIPRGLSSIGVITTDIPFFAHNALSDAYITTNPRRVTEADIREICLNAY